MAAELDKLARQFKSAGDKDIAAGISAWAQVARSRGRESFTSPVLPEGAQRFSLEIGGKTAAQYKEALRKAGINVSSYANSLLDSPAFTTLPEAQTLDLVKMTIAGLGFKRVATTGQIFKKAQELGLELCPAEVGPAQRLADTEQEMNNWYSIGMKPITDSDGYPWVFDLEHVTDGLWLYGRWASPGSEWDPRDEFVFSLSKFES